MYVQEENEIIPYYVISALDAEAKASRDTDWLGRNFLPSSFYPSSQFPLLHPHPHLINSCFETRSGSEILYEIFSASRGLVLFYIDPFVWSIPP